MLNVAPNIPICAFIIRELSYQTESVEFAEGARVRSELGLAKTYGVSRNPTRQALIQDLFILLDGQLAAQGDVFLRMKGASRNGLIEREAPGDQSDERGGD